MGITDFFSDLLSSVSFVQDVHAEAPADDDESKEGGDDEANDEDGGDDKEEGGDEEGGDEEEGGDDDEEEEEEEEEEEPVDPKPQLEEGMFTPSHRGIRIYCGYHTRIDADQILNRQTAPNPRNAQATSTTTTSASNGSPQPKRTQTTKDPKRTAWKNVRLRIYVAESVATKLSFEYTRT